MFGCKIINSGYDEIMMLSTKNCVIITQRKHFFFRNSLKLHLQLKKCQRPSFYLKIKNKFYWIFKLDAFHSQGTLGGLLWYENDSISGLCFSSPGSTVHRALFSVKFQLSYNEKYSVGQEMRGRDRVRQRGRDREEPNGERQSWDKREKEREIKEQENRGRDSS